VSLASWHEDLLLTSRHAPDRLPASRVIRYGGRCITTGTVNHEADPSERNGRDGRRIITTRWWCSRRRRRFCGPNHIHSTHDTYALGATVARAALKRGLDTWFFIMPDYAMGKSQVASITHILERNGGKVLGTVAHPLPGTSDFSSHLLRAQSSGADPLVTNAG
jgi:hypothetical protein